MSDAAPRSFRMPQGIGTDHAGPGALAIGERSYKIAIVNNSTIIWEEVALFFDMLGIPGSVPQIATGSFPPGTTLNFFLCPCSRFNSLAFGIFFRDVNGALLSYPVDTAETLWTREELQQQTGRPCDATIDVTFG